MKSRLIGWTFLLICLFCGYSSTFATHIVGVDIRYDIIGPCTYRIFFTQYFDCAGGFMSPYLPVSTTLPPPPPALSGGFTITGVGPGCVSPSPLGSWGLVSYEEVTPLCPALLNLNQPGQHPTACEGSLGNPNPPINGVAAATHFVDYYFCNTNCLDFVITYDDCCRSNAITSGAASDGIFLQNSMNIGSVNNAPVFDGDPVFLVCDGSVLQIPLDGTDPDGDSLAYSLGPCYDSPAVPVGYVPGYSPTVPLGSSWNVSLDALTGLLSVAPNGLGAGGQVVSVVCVEVKEYRNGALIGVSNRDFQITILPNCGNSTPAIGPMQLLGGGNQMAADTLQACVGGTLHFQITGTDPDQLDTLHLSSDIDQILPGAQLSYSGINPATIDIVWTPDSSHLNQIYEFSVDADDFVCPLPGTANRTFYLEVSTPCISGLVTDAACLDSTGVIDLTVVGDSGVSYSYLWSTGDTTEDVQGLPVGSYWVDVLDGSGQVFLTDTFFISATDLTLIPTFTVPDCDLSNGQIDLAVIGGMMPYSYAWSNGSQMSSLVGVPAGGYSVTVTDVNGCPKNEVYFLDEPDSCFVSVSGTVFYDLNGNCVQDSNELGIPYMYIELGPGGATFTDQNGNYSISIDTGAIVLEVLPAPSSYWVPTCPANGLHILTLGDYGADTTGVDFAMYMPPVQDLRIAGIAGNFNPGFPYFYHLQIYNDGNLVMDANWSLQLDSLMGYNNVIPGPGTYDPVTHTVSGMIYSLLPGQSFTMTIGGVLDTSAVLGDSMMTIATVLPITGDTTPDNNIFIDSAIVVGSFDPNDKGVSPQGQGPEGFIQAEENEMHYTIRFQNTGNFPAQFVIIRDTIHPNLDLSSYQPMTNSHPYTLNVEEDSILVFTFANIQLPDSASDPDGSQGHVSFQLLHEGTLSIGDRMTNSAAIYFDFNEPIITNEVVNTIYAPLAIGFVVDSLLCSQSDSIQGLLTQTGLAPYTYVWSTGEQLLASSDMSSSTVVDTSAYYTLTVTDALGISVSDSIFVEVSPLPVAQVNTLIQGTDVQFLDLSQNANSWFWDFGDGGSSTDPSPSHSYQTEGEFDVMLVVSNICGTDTLSFTLTLPDVVSITADGFAQSVETIPNPFSQQTLIRFANPQQRPFELIMMDVQGKVVRQYAEIRSEEIVVERGNLSRGMYLFHLRGEKGQYIGKLMVE